MGKNDWMWWLGGLGAVAGGFVFLFMTPQGKQIIRPFVIEFDRIVSENAGIPPITELVAGQKNMQQKYLEAYFADEYLR